MMIKKSVADKLTNQERDIVERVNALHTSNMGASERDKHSLDKIIKVEYNKAEKCLNVHYEHEWYHYTMNGWY
jgi:hypothetical protein